MRFCTLIGAVALVLALGAADSHAIPSLINYQGILTDGGGVPIVVATNVEFRIWDDAAAGNELWMESQLVAPDADGLFNVLLGTNNPIPDSALAGAAAFLGVTIAPDPELSPRTEFVAVAYAYRPGTVDGATGGNITSKVTIGQGHTNTGADAFVAGNSNVATGDQSVIGGGLTQSASGTLSTIAGGRSNDASGTVSAIGGGIGNVASGAFGATVAGGESNTAAESRATVGGGASNQALGARSVVAGGGNNRADSMGTTVGGGRYNRATGRFATVAGGGGETDADSNLASGGYSTISGGRINLASGFISTIAGGSINTASATSAVIGGGVGNIASGGFSIIPGGWYNQATETGSIALGMSAHSVHEGSVVMTADHSPNTFNPVLTDTTGQFVLMARRSFCFTNTTGTAPHVAGRFINTITDAHLTSGGTWTNSSDANKKENFAPVDRAELLEKIAELDIQRWNYRTEDPSVQHIGPVAQEFHALFKVGHDDKTISTIDPAGIALAAIQELNERTKQIEVLGEENAELREQIQELRRMIEDLANNK